MAVTEAICCPACRWCGGFGRDLELQTIDNVWRCGRCEWSFTVDDDGRTQHWLDVYAAGRKAKRKGARRCL